MLFQSYNYSLWEHLQIERNIIRKRQVEGIAKAKLKGVYDNRKRKKKLSDKRTLELVANGFNKTEIAEILDVSRMTVHRVFKSQIEILNLSY